MARDYSSVPEKDLAAGINQQAPEDSIPAGFVEHAENVDFNSEGLVEKRTGFRTYLGSLPIRVAAVTQRPATNSKPAQVIFNLTSKEHPNQDVDLSNVAPGPILVVGQTAAELTEFGTDKIDPDTKALVKPVQYYSTFASNPRKIIEANKQDILDFPQAEHGFSTENLLVGVTESLSQTNKNNKHVFLENIEIDSITKDVALHYNNADGELNTFVYALAADTSGVGFSAIYAATTSIIIPAATHSLNTFNILSRVYVVDGDVLRQVIPEETIVNENNGNVTITFTESGTYKVVLYAAPVAQQLIDSVVSGASDSAEGGGRFTIPDLDEGFIFLDCFLRDAVTGNLSKIMPNSVEINAITGVATVGFSNPFTEDQNIVFAWEYAKVKTTTLIVTANKEITSAYDEEQPELCIYGLLAEEIFPARESPRSGWVQHIDTYKSEGYNTVVAGMGWNLFQAVKQPDAASYLKATVLYPSLRARARSSATLGPLFQETVSDASFITRTRGAETFQGGAQGWARIDSISWSEDDQGYWVSLATPDRLAVTKAGQPLVVPFTDTTRYGDLLSIRGAELKYFDGEWPVWEVDDTVADEYKVLIKTSFTSQDYNCLNSGEAGIFTDRFVIDHRPLLTRGDLISAQSFPQGTQVGYIGTDRAANPYLYVSGAVEEIQVANGQLINLSRDEKYCYGPRSADGQFRDFSVERPVLKGDSLVIAGRAGPVEVGHVLSTNLSGITASVNSEVLTLTNINNARQFSVGQRVLVHDLGYDSAEFEVTEIGVDNTTLILAAPGVSDMAELSACQLLPQLAFREVVSISDDSFNRGTFTIEGRWEIIEKPRIDDTNLTAYNNVARRATEHFKSDEYGTQALVRSTMSQNNLYLTNDNDPIQKFDGFNLYRAGIIRWNPQLFLRIQKDGGISISTKSTCWYYFRLGGIDANGNEVVSATTGVEDYKVTLSQSSSIHMRLIGLPVWDNYDFEKLTLQIYRTEFYAEDVVPVFYLVGELEMPQTAGAGYIDFVDTESDVTLVRRLRDAGINSTAGDFLSAVTLSGPTRAKYITSLNNRIVLGNLRGYQTLSTRFEKANAAITTEDFNGKQISFYRDANILDATDVYNKLTVEYTFYEGNTLPTNVRTVTVKKTPPVNPVFLNDYMTITTASAIPLHIAIGDWVYLTEIATTDTHTGLKCAGWYQITALPTTSSFTVYAPNDYVSTANIETNIHINCAVFRTLAAPFGTIPILLHDKDCNFKYDSAADDNVLTVTHRTASAINVAMRLMNPSIAGQAGFVPWIIADAGGDFNLGEMRFRKPKDGPSFAVEFSDDFFGDDKVYVVCRGLQYATEVTLGSTAPVFPSRIVYSYQNFPEVFNKIDQRLITNADSDSHLPVDVNAADGQEITGIIPFFGESAFGQATRESLLVVFKTNSIYLVDLRVDNSGNVLGDVQKIESQGLGCTAPYSIASTKDGIMFANESGIYKLTRQLTVEPIGQFVDRIWREEVDVTQLALTQGHHFGVGRQYKLSVPLRDATANSDVLVYEHTRESRGVPGAWGRYTNHEVTGWANLLDQEFFATIHGRVCVRNNTATKWDYSDRGTAIVAKVDLRPNDLGIPNIRKRLLHLSVHFRNPQETGVNITQKYTKVSMATDLYEDFYECNEYESQGLYSKTGISDLGLLKGETVRFSVPTSKAIQFQTRIQNDGLYETVQFSGVTYRVSAASTKGTKEAQDTKK